MGQLPAWAGEQSPGAGHVSHLNSQPAGSGRLNCRNRHFLWKKNPAISADRLSCGALAVARRIQRHAKLCSRVIKLWRHVRLTCPPVIVLVKLILHLALWAY
jgi:hypothetical protein